MGYQTYMDGIIEFGKVCDSTNASIEAMTVRLNKIDSIILKNGDFEFVNDGEFWELHICCEWKNYWTVCAMKGFEEDSDNSLLAVLKRLAVFFPEETTGEISGKGEDSEDMWRIEVKGRTFILSEAKIEYVPVDSITIPDEAYESVDVIKARLRGVK